MGNSKRWFCRVFITLLLWLIAIPVYAVNDSSLPNSSYNNTINNQGSEKVTTIAFLIIVDGLQADALDNADAPNIKGLRSAGLKANRVISGCPEDSQLAISSILTGGKLLQDGNDQNILQLITDRGMKTALFDGTGKLKSLKAEVNYISNKSYNGSDSLVVDDVINELDKNNAYFNVIVLPGLRIVLEEHGAGSAEYRQQVADTDNQVGRLLHYLYTKNWYEQSLIIVTGTGEQPPLIMKGLQLKAGTTLPPVNLTDIAPTIAYLLGIKMKETDGMVLYNAIKPQADRSETYLLTQRVEDLSEFCAIMMEGIYRLEREKAEVKQHQKLIANEKQLIQQEIEKRDQKIENLSSKISFMKITGVILLVIFILGYIVEYKILRKKFLMF